VEEERREPVAGDAVVEGPLLRAVKKAGPVEAYVGEPPVVVYAD
jgi:hypothetical protein